MNDQQLRQALETIGQRDRQLALRWVLAALWLSLALIVVAIVARGRGASGAVVLFALPLIAVVAFALPYLFARRRAARDSVALGPRIEERFPVLNARLLTALEQRPATAGGELGFLQQSVIGQALDHARAHPWQEVVPTGRLRVASAGQWLSLAILL